MEGGVGALPATRALTPPCSPQVDALQFAATLGDGLLLGGALRAPAPAWETASRVHRGRAGGGSGSGGPFAAASSDVAASAATPRAAAAALQPAHSTRAWLLELALRAEQRSGAPPGSSCGVWTSPFASSPPPPLSQPTPGASSSSFSLQDVHGTHSTPVRSLTYDELFSGEWESAPPDEQEEPEESIHAAAAKPPLPDRSDAAHTHVADASPAEAPPSVSVLDDVAAALSAAAESCDFWTRGSTSSPQAAPPTSWAVTLPLADVAATYAREVGASPAMRYPYELDTFQKEAIIHLERHQSVFVAAHTSAGKTAVAEYALALCAKHATRCVYTSPIKTISNQKFRDFTRQGFDTGLLTGDVALRPQASALVMTTEILRSMLYRGADCIRDIEWVIFDEVHYVNDAERGVVWEEVIIMLPQHVSLVMLSATVPNVAEFADWVGRTRREKVYVVGTHKRPVPLEHCLFHGGKLWKVAEQGTFLPQGMRALAADKKAKLEGKTGSRVVPPAGRGGAAAHPSHRPHAGVGGAQGAASLVRRNGAPGSSGGGGGGELRMGEKSLWLNLLAHLKTAALLPAVVFAFSKRKVDASADCLTSCDLTSSAEKAAIHRFCCQAFGRLSASDAQLPQILRVRALLSRGIGVHHAGLLPIVKEVVEHLFCTGAIKLLFATETFAMGVNAPARAVAFAQLRKHDGREFRALTSGEYTQMAGRAGRRGLDTVGTVILLTGTPGDEQVPEEGELRRLLTGSATRLESQFRLTYSMILNLCRVEDLRVEDMLRRSFAEFHAQRALAKRSGAAAGVRAALGRARAAAAAAEAEDSGAWHAARAHAVLSARAAQLATKVSSLALTSRGGAAAATPGRLLRVLLPPPNDTSVTALLLRCANDGQGGKAYVVLVAPWRGPPPAKGPLDLRTPQPGALAAATQPVRVLSKKADADDGGGLFALSSKRGASSAAAAAAATHLPQGLPATLQAGGMSCCVMALPGARVLALTRAKLPPGALDAAAVADRRDPAATARALAAFVQLCGSPGGEATRCLDPVKDLHLEDPQGVEACLQLQSTLASLDAIPAPACGGGGGGGAHPEWAPLACALERLERALAEEAAAASDAALERMPDYRARCALLKHLGYLEADDTVTLKGRVACEVNTACELLTSELVFAGCFAHLTPPQLAALLSALVLQERSDCAPGELPAALARACDEALDTAQRLAQAQERFAVPVDPDTYVASVLKFGLVEAVHAWASGAPFLEVAQLTDIPEGTIVRTIVRLHELCRELRTAAALCGDGALAALADAAALAIKRDIVFSASLYVAAPDAH